MDISLNSRAYRQNNNVNFQKNPINSQKVKNAVSSVAITATKAGISYGLAKAGDKTFFAYDFVNNYILGDIIEYAIRSLRIVRKIGDSDLKFYAKKKETEDILAKKALDEESTVEAKSILNHIDDNKANLLTIFAKKVYFNKKVSKWIFKNKSN